MVGDLGAGVLTHAFFAQWSINFLRNAWKSSRLSVNPAAETGQTTSRRLPVFLLALASLQFRKDPLVTRGLDPAYIFKEPDFQELGVERHLGVGVFGFHAGHPVSVFVVDFDDDQMRFL